MCVDATGPIRPDGESVEPEEDRPYSKLIDRGYTGVSIDVEEMDGVL